MSSKKQEVQPPKIELVKVKDFLQNNKDLAESHKMQSPEK